MESPQKGRHWKQQAQEKACISDAACNELLELIRTVCLQFKRIKVLKICYFHIQLERRIRAEWRRDRRESVRYVIPSSCLLQQNSSRLDSSPRS